MRFFNNSRKNKKPKDQKAALVFICVGVTTMFALNYFVFDKHSYHDDIKAEYYAERAIEQAALEAQKYDPVADSPYVKNPPKMVYPDDGGLYFEQEFMMPAPDVFEEEGTLIAPKAKPAVKLAAKPAIKGNGAKIAIVIDDVGMNRKWSAAAMRLDKNVTLALLPYAEQVKADAQKARARGHELIIHAPMEAMTPDLDYGGMGLLASMGAPALNARFNQISQSFEGYSGVNNHMGSKLTQDANAMRAVMRNLKSRGLYFLDSKTIHTSVAAKIAAEEGVPFAVRDVFLDHEDSAAYVANALNDLERIAAEHGSAIAIGHPKEHTIKALEKWLPSLKERGFNLVPLSSLIEKTPAARPKVMQASQEITPELIEPASGDVIENLESDAITPYQQVNPEGSAFSIY